MYHALTPAPVSSSPCCESSSTQQRTLLSYLLHSPSIITLHHIASHCITYTSHHITGSDTIELNGDHISVVLEGDFFEGCGVGPHVPVYLRFEGRVRNLRISRATILRLIHEIWIEKARQEGRPIESAFLNITGGQMGVVVPAASSSLDAISPPHNATSLDTIAVVAPTHYVRLLPSLPPNATLAEFFNCYLRVSHF